MVTYINLYMEEKEQKVSKYNSGIAIIMRLDGLWKDVNLHSRANQYIKWNADLDRLWCELARDLSDTDYKAKKILFDVFDSSIAQAGAIVDSAPEGFKKVDKDGMTKRQEQYKLLIEKELFLRRLENFLGKGTAWDDDDDDGFD